MRNECRNTFCRTEATTEKRYRKAHRPWQWEGLGGQTIIGVSTDNIYMLTLNQ